MSHLITMQISDVVFNRAQQVSQETGLIIEQVLQHWLEERVATIQRPSLIPNMEYIIDTPDESYEAARILEASRDNDANS